MTWPRSSRPSTCASATPTPAPTSSHEDIVTPGHYEDFYRRVQQEPNTFFVKGEVSRVDEGPDGDLLVTLQQSLLAAEVQIPVDLVVLAIGMAPSTAVSPVLQLLYRQGPGPPQAKYGFSDSNFICFPYESQRTGLYAAGTVREPMDLPLCQEDASGAALKAIQSLTLVSAGASTHPRARRPLPARDPPGRLHPVRPLLPGVPLQRH